MKEVAQELDNICSELVNAINDALDALDRGDDNDWAREALERVSPVIERYYELRREQKTLTHYYKDGSLYQTQYPGLKCAVCGCNVFHEEYDGANVRVICNSCGNLIAELLPDAAKAALAQDVWK